MAAYLINTLQFELLTGTRKILNEYRLLNEEAASTLQHALKDVAFSAGIKVNRGQFELTIIKQTQRSKTRCIILILQGNYLAMRLFVKLDATLKDNGVSI